MPRRPAFASHVPALAELEAHGGAAAPELEEGHQALAGAEEQPAGLPSAKLKAGAAGPGPPGPPGARPPLAVTVARPNFNEPGIWSLRFVLCTVLNSEFNTKFRTASPKRGRGSCKRAWGAAAFLVRLYRLAAALHWQALRCQLQAPSADYAAENTQTAPAPP